MTQMGGHLITAGGKRARPLFTVASAAALAQDPAAVAQAVTPEVVLGGVSVELVQVGSLCHDDVIDEAETRRGVDSVNARWGNLKAILAGDFLLAKASEIAASLGTEVAGAARGDDRAALRRRGQRAAPRLRPRPHDRVVPRRHRGQDGRALRHRLPGRWDRGRPAPRAHRPPHRLRAPLRDGVPDRRRRARRHRHRRAARQAGRPRHRGGHLQPPGAPRPRGARRRPRRPSSAVPSTGPTSTPLAASSARRRASTAASTWPAATSTKPSTC